MTVRNEDILQDFALLKTGGIHILILQSQIESVSHIEDRLAAQSEMVSSVAVLNQHINAKVRSFVTVSDRLTLLPKIGRNIFVQTTWNIVPSVHWCWEEVKWLNQVKLKLQPIPKILQTKGLPTHAITTLNDGTIAFVCEAAALLQFIAKKEEL